MPELEYKIVKNGDVLTNLSSDFVLLVHDGFIPVENWEEKVRPFILNTIIGYLPNEVRNGSYYYLKTNEIGNSMIIRTDAAINRPIQFSPQFLMPIMAHSPISNIPLALVQNE